MPIDYSKRRSSTAGPTQGSPQPTGTPPPAAMSPARVTLTKAAPVVSLTKGGTTGGRLRVNLRWTAQSGTGRRGLFKRRAASDVDLDLGCLFEYTDGSKGVVQALGGSFRDKHTLGPDPITWLDGDDRSGGAEGGENLFVDLSKAAAIRRILVFAYIYEGIPNWAAANGIVTLFPASGPQVEIALDEHNPRCPMVAVALIQGQGSEIVVQREVRYVQGKQRALDEAYGWGMNWTPSKK